jgi:DNA topoisomerase-3
MAKPKPASPARLLCATKIAPGRGFVIPDASKANAAATGVCIDSNKGTKRRNTAFRTAGSIATKSKAPVKVSRKRKAAARSTPTQSNPAAGTPLRIPYGNKDVALKLGARYGSTGWYAPPGVDLSAFGERGWL